MTTDERDRIFNDPDYISSKRYNYSLNKFLKHHERGVPDSMIASLLKMTTEEVEQRFGMAVAMYREKLGLN